MCKTLNSLSLILTIFSLLAGLSSLMAQNDRNAMFWQESLNCLSENIHMFDKKTYEENGDLLKILNYQIKAGKLYEKLWVNSTKKREIREYDLEKVAKISIECKTSCVLTLSFYDRNSQESKQYRKLVISNCEINSLSNCANTTWSRNDDFVVKFLEALNRLSTLNHDLN